jgi:hypothetical protein
MAVCEDITKAIKDEAVQLETFLELTDEDMNVLFGYYLKSKPLKFGIKKQLQLLQSKLKSQLKTNKMASEDKCELRKFDKPLHTEYLNLEVSYPSGGDQNAPAHEFVYTGFAVLSKYVVVKNTVRFISACLNARKNGTIHFGIERTGRNTGKIVGVNNTSLLRSIDNVVLTGIHRCFKHLSTVLRRNIIRCTRPAQIIKVKHESLVVVEIDIVPFHKHLSDSFYTVMFPPSGPQTESFFLYEEGPSCDIVQVENARVEAVKKDLQDSLRERQLLDDETLRRYRSESDRASFLMYELTRGADYITDVFFPIICSGNMNSDNFVNYPGLQDAFQNSCAVFDFGSSTHLRKIMEEGNPLYTVNTVKTLSDFETDEKDVSFSDKEKPWIYCNGNDDTGIEVLDADSWTDKRLIPLENILRYMKSKIPN